MLLRIGFKNVPSFQICGLFASCVLSPQELGRQVTLWSLPSYRLVSGIKALVTDLGRGGNASSSPNVSSFFVLKVRTEQEEKNGWACLEIVLLAYFESKYNLNSLGMSISGGWEKSSWLTISNPGAGCHGTLCNPEEKQDLHGAGRAAQARSEGRLPNCPVPLAQGQ